MDLNSIIPNSYDHAKFLDKNHVATPRWVVEQIYSLINIQSYAMCWFPFNNYDSEFKLKADELRLKYKATHKFDDLGNDFFVTDPPEQCDLMISNPPFSLQNKIIARSFDLIEQGKIKAFALLLPLATLETKPRADLLEQYIERLSIIIFKKRIRFIGKKTGFNKAVCWLCYNIENLPAISWI